MICISMISLGISLLGFVQLTEAVKFVPLQPHGRNHLLIKPYAFYQPIITNTFFPSLATQNLYPTVNHKLYT